MWQWLKPRQATLRLWQAALLIALFAFWYAMTTPGLIPPFMFDNDRQAAFFFGEPLKVLARIWVWFVTQADIYRHLGVTLVETLLAFVAGSVLGLAAGLWLALAPMASAILEPYVKALNSMPRIILAPIFSVWFGLGIGSKVALGVTLVCRLLKTQLMALGRYTWRSNWRELAPSMRALASTTGLTSLTP